MVRKGGSPQKIALRCKVLLLDSEGVPNRTAAAADETRAEVLLAVIGVDKMNFDYRVTGGNPQIRPLRVFDDGATTYIQMPSAIQHMEAPVLLVLGSDGKGTMTNYRVKKQTYIVDRLFERARMVLGAGKNTRQVEISRAKKG